MKEGADVMYMSGGNKVQLGSRVNESSASRGTEVDKGHSQVVMKKENARTQDTALGHTRSDRERLGCDGVELDKRSTP